MGISPQTVATLSTMGGFLNLIDTCCGSELAGDSGGLMMILDSDVRADHVQVTPEKGIRLL
jgi:hypothetical protein